MATQTSTTSKSSKEETGKKRERKTPLKHDGVSAEPALTATNLQGVVADPQTAKPAEILALQHRSGNRAVTQLIQTKLKVGPANDHYEQEADRVAAQVMSAPAETPSIQRQGDEAKIQAKPLAASITPLVQRSSESEDDELQAKSITNGGSFLPGADFESQLATTRGGGKPMPKTTREFMEQRFGEDFSGVRLHTGSESSDLNRAIHAQAFTQGQDIYLGEGKENIESNSGKQLLAHEFTHVVQQTGTQKASTNNKHNTLQREVFEVGSADHVRYQSNKVQNPDSDDGNFDTREAALAAEKQRLNRSGLSAFGNLKARALHKLDKLRGKPGTLAERQDAMLNKGAEEKEQGALRYGKLAIKGAAAAAKAGVTAGASALGGPAGTALAFAVNWGIGKLVKWSTARLDAELDARARQAYTVIGSQKHEEMKEDFGPGDAEGPQGYVDIPMPGEAEFEIKDKSKRDAVAKILKRSAKKLKDKTQEAIKAELAPKKLNATLLLEGSAEDIAASLLWEGIKLGLSKGYTLAAEKIDEKSAEGDRLAYRALGDEADD